MTGDGHMFLLLAVPAILVLGAISFSGSIGLGEGLRREGIAIATLPQHLERQQTLRRVAYGAPAPSKSVVPRRLMGGGHLIKSEREEMAAPSLPSASHVADHQSENYYPNIIQRALRLIVKR